MKFPATGHMAKKFVFHHVGIAVLNLEEASAFYSQILGFQVISGPIEDTVQKVRACFVGASSLSSAPIELICPLDSASPIGGYLAKGIGAYHVCFEVGGVDDALTELQRNG